METFRKYPRRHISPDQNGVDFTKGSDVLGRFFKGFRVRESVGVERNSDEVWETNLTLLANHWVVETDSTWDWMRERVTVSGLYLQLVGGMAWRKKKTVTGST